MDIKLKKSNNTRLLIIVCAFLLCVTSFTAAVTIGITELTKAGEVGDPYQLLTAKTYWESGELQQDFSSAYQSLYSAKTQKPGGEADMQNLADDGFRYFVSNGKQTATNLESPDRIKTPKDLEALGEKQGAYRLYTNSRLTGSPQVRRVDPYWGDVRLNRQIADFGVGILSENGGEKNGAENLTVYLSYSPKYVADKQSDYNSVGVQLRNALAVVGVAVFLWLASFIVLCVLIGKREEDGKAALRGMAGWFTEIPLLLSLALAVLGMSVSLSAGTGYQYLDYYGYEYGYYYLPRFNAFEIGVAATFIWITGAGALYCLLAVIRKAKAKRFFSDFLVVSFAQWIGGGLKDIYYGSSVMKKVIIAVFIMCLGSATVVLFPVAVVLACVFAAKWVRQYEEIKKGVKEVRNGNPAYKIPVSQNREGELEQLAEDINAISSGFDVAVKQELKNQRMKTELISNVSHDIKTPLTSIITYVDLLKKEGLDCPDADKYLDIVDQKSIRLKKLTEDLFEAAKASSGDIPVHMEKVELLSLLNQTMGELSDRLAERKLDVIVKAQAEKYYVEADGQLMWRVLENLFGNAIKYALENSRVYVDIYGAQRASDGKPVSVLEMKNVSKYPLNIPAEELMERFKRGDESRTTEGSGLGLSIARDLINMQNGRFDLLIDGDLFKAIITLDDCQ